MSDKFRYYTNFSFVLTTETGSYENAALEDKNFGAADAFLRSEEMAQYLDDHLREKVTKVEWNLESTDEGTIDVEAKRELTPDELAELSDWIRGQCSDGLGESFEQRDFAQVYDYEEDWGEEECVGMISFDWEFNDYKLRKS